MANKLQRARRARLGLDHNSPIVRFWRWWSGELLELVPHWLRRSNSSVANTLLVEIGAGAIVFRRWIQGKLTELGRSEVKASDSSGQSVAFQALANKLRKRGDLVALWLGEGQYLSKQVELPAATAENLRQVLGFEMDRHSPFKSEQVYFDFGVLKKDVQRDRIDVRLALAPRVDVDSALELLARWGLPAQGVYVDDAIAAGEEPLNLMPPERRTRKSSTLLWLNVGLLAGALLLVMAAVLVPIVQKRQQVIALLPIVDKAKQEAEATDALRREWERRSAEYNFVLEKKAAVPPVVVQLDELAKLLPDDTWVQQFDLRGKELQLQGETASSSKLIGLLESSKMLRDASFRSPLTKGLGANSERFHVAATVKPIPIEVAPAAAVPAPAVAPPAPPATVPAAVAPAAASAAPPAGKQAPGAPPAKPAATPNPPQPPAIPAPVGQGAAAKPAQPPLAPQPPAVGKPNPALPAAAPNPPARADGKPAAAPAPSAPPAAGKAPQVRGGAQ